jgi:acetyl esterase/lipase
MTKRRRLLLPVAALLLALGGGLLAVKGPSVVSIWTWVYRSLLAESGVVVQTGIPFGTSPRQLLDVYRPASEDQNGPIVLFIYGGTWGTGDRAPYGFVGYALAARGITTVIADYRLYPEVAYPGFVEDGALAYAWISSKLAPTPSGRRRPIILMGHSAGAYNASLLAFDDRWLAQAHAQDRPAGFIGLAGPYSFFPTLYDTTKAIFATATDKDEPRPVTHVRTGAPPSLLMHGKDDTTVKLGNLEDMTQALQAVHAPVKTLVFDGTDHMGVLLAIARPLRWRAPVLKETMDFIGSLKWQLIKLGKRTPEIESAASILDGHPSTCCRDPALGKRRSERMAGSRGLAPR